MFQLLFNCKVKEGIFNRQLIRELFKDVNFKDYMTLLEKRYNMSFKLYFLPSHLDHFLKNLGFVSEEISQRYSGNGKPVSRKVDHSARAHNRTCGIRKFASNIITFLIMYDEK